MSILLSFFLFPKPFTLFHGLAVGFVFSGVFTHVIHKSGSKSSTPSDSSSLVVDVEFSESDKTESNPLWTSMSSAVDSREESMHVTQGMEVLSSAPVISAERSSLRVSWREVRCLISSLFLFSLSLIVLLNLRCRCR